MKTLTLNQLTDIISSSTLTRELRPNVSRRKAIGAVIFLISDVLFLMTSLFTSFIIRDLVYPDHKILFDYYPNVLALIPLFCIVFAVRGLYPSFGKDVVEELRTLTIGITLVYLILAVVSFFITELIDYSRLAFGVSWILSLVALPLGRAIVKEIFSKRSWWGVPVVIVGGEKSGQNAILSLQNNPKMGLRPYIAIDEDADKWGYFNGVPVVGGYNILPDLAEKLGIEQIIIAMPQDKSEKQDEIIKLYCKHFKRTLVIPEYLNETHFFVSVNNINGILTLELKEKLLQKPNVIFKRLFDIVVSSILLILLLPLFAVIALAIKINSKGPALFYQDRMGKDDVNFKIIKFRTMYHNAEEHLEKILNSDPDMKLEFEIYHKLRHDPRLTKVGKFLRMFSLDEIPQFINVLQGTMSLMGPRACLPNEKSHMNGLDEVILKVKPGISGLWQVTDMNSTFGERNLIDIYYIRNWSIFLDFYIFVRTISVILHGKNG
ncbi:MAG: undecaprenyl-phosphate galactose phosphotransferase WbaP [bacterium]